MIDSQPMTRDSRRGHMHPLHDRKRDRIRKLAAEAKQRRFAIIGEAVMTEAATDPTLQASVREILSRRILSPITQADIADTFGWQRP